MPGQTEGPEGQASDFEYTLLDDYTVSVAWGGEDNPPAQVEIPAAGEIDGVPYRVSQVAPHGFEDKNFESVSIPSSVASIGEAAFRGCGSLTSVSLCEGLASIGKDAFAGSGVETLKLPASVAFVGERAFANCGNLLRIVTLSEPDVDDTALAGCAGVSVYLPYCEDGAYSWNVGVMASGNHLMPYGISLPDEPLRLAVGASADLFEGGFCEIPEGAELGYAYSATPFTVDAGTITGKREGVSEVEARLLLEGVELARASRTVEVEAASSDGASDGEKEAGQVKPPIVSLLAPLNDSEQEDAGQVIEPRGEYGVCGGCTWYIGNDGVLFIQKPRGGSGVLDPFTNGAPWAIYASKITQVSFDAGIKAGSSVYGMFGDCSKLQYIHFYDFDTSSVSDMSYMFSGCTSLQTLDLSGFNTSNVTDMKNMFSNCSSLKTLDLSGFNTSNVTDMKSMFSDCTSLKSVDVSSFITSKVTDMSYLFQGCKSLATLDLSNFNTSAVEIFAWAFSQCFSLADLKLPDGFIGPNVRAAHSLFSNCNKLTTIPANLAFENADILLSSCFYSSETTVLPTRYEGSDPALLAYNWAKDNRKLLKRFAVTFEANGGSPAPSKQAVWEDDLVAKPADPTKAGLEFGGWYKDAACTEAWDFAKDTVQGDTTLYAGFFTVKPTLCGGCTWWIDADSALHIEKTPGGTGVLESFASGVPWATYAAKITSVESGSGVKAGSSVNGMFAGCTNLKSVDFSDFDTSSVTDMSKMFSNCSSLTNLDLSGFDTSLATTMASMFLGCSSFAALDLSGFSTSSVSVMSNMFYGCSSLADLKLPDGFIGPKVAYVTRLFSGCNSLSAIPANLSFSNLDVPSDCFYNSGPGVLPTYYAGFDQKLMHYDWDANNRQFGLFVEFEANGGSPVPESLFVQLGSKIIEPTAPAKEGCTFVGWYEDSACTKKYDFSSRVYYGGSRKLYAGYCIASPTACGGCTWWVEDDGTRTLHIEKTPYGTGVLESFTNGYSSVPWRSHAARIVSVKFGPGVKAGSNISFMFAGFGVLKSIDFADFDTSAATNMSSLFSRCSSLADLTLPDGFIGPNTVTVDNLFSGCNKLTTIPANLAFGSLDIPGDCFSVSGSTPLPTRYEGSDPALLAYNWANDNRKLLKRFTVTFEANGGSPAPAKQAVWEDDLVAKLADPSKTGFAFTGWYKDAACTEAWDFAKDTVQGDTTLYAGYCIAPPAACGGCTWWIDADGTLHIEKTPGGTGVLESFAGSTYVPWRPYMTQITSARFGQGIKAGANICYMFLGCTNLVSVDFADFDTSAVSNMSYLFADCSSLVSFDATSFDTSAVTDMNRMFRKCRALTSLDLSSFCTSSVTDMTYLFTECQNLTDIKLPDGFIGSKVNAVEGLFNRCNKLTTIPANLAFGSLDIPEGCFFAAPGPTPLPTRYAGTDAKLRAYNWAKDNRQLVATYTVSFRCDGSSGGPANQTVFEGDTAKKPGDPVRKGYVFSGWYTDAALTAPYDFSLPVTSNLVLYAKWTLVIAGTVPLEATFVVNASGGVEETACEITSTTVEPLKIVSVECIEEPGAKGVFPVDADRSEIAVSLKPGAANAVSLAFGSALQESSLKDFSLEANGRLSLALGLSLPEGIRIEPTGTDNDPDATKAVARLMYTVAPAQSA